MSATPKLELDRFLPYRLSILSNLVSSAIAGNYSERFGISIPEWRVMAVLAIEPDLSAAQVAERTAMDKVAVSRAVARLLARGSLERKIAPTDRRKSMLRLSADGERIYAEVVPIARDHERVLLDVLAADDRLALERILTTLLGRARTLGDPR
ncbi:MAG: MarR family winged helix-turn-helix transcriptional regulator [Hyphomicrobiales bacterium]|nr:MarR family winged helix-turn-helix transcriptional regulator [Hyphomicrobiales bacterium]